MEATGIRLFGTMISCPHSLKMDEKNRLEEDEQLRQNNQKQETETEGDATNLSHDILKKPDKILQCPRCNSMDTKFCYYNNYNVKQPRHLCKSCQRYWTAGGTRRTMPVGAGRRKLKNPTSSCRFENIYHEAPNVISFGLDLQHVDSLVSCVNKENTDDCSSGSTVTISNSVDETTHARNGFPNVPCIQGVSWSYIPWNSVIPIPIVYPSTYLNYIPWLPVSTTPSLGKHSRDGEILLTPNVSEETKKHKSSVLVPKTLRIDDPDEAAKSSIWSTLGIKNETIGTRGIFKAFGIKSEENNKVSNAYPVLQANPAALSRSLYFQEGA